MNGFWSRGITEKGMRRTGLCRVRHGPQSSVSAVFLPPPSAGGRISELTNEVCELL